MITRANYQEILEKALQATDTDLDQLRATAQLQTQEVREANNSTILELQNRRNLMAEKLKELKDCDNALWQRLKAELDDIFSRMGRGFEKVSAANATAAVVDGKYTPED